MKYKYLPKNIILLLILINYFFIIYNKINKKPKITIFLPIYNMEKFLSKAISLLLKQTLKDIEIIAINDFSIDKSYDILRQFSLKDKRIKIINNTKNFGLLYSRAMGIIHSSGEYLINLDPDDEFKEDDNLEYLYNKTNNSKIDIISYSYLVKSSNKITNLCNKNNLIIKQPNLFESSIHDYLIWNKMIKREIFLKAYKILEKYIYYKKWNYHEDNIWSLLVHKSASTKLCLNKLIYIYNNNINNQSIMSNRYNLLEFTNIIYRLEMEIKIFNNSIYFNSNRNRCYSLISTINVSALFKKHIIKNKELKNKISENLKICIKNYNISQKFLNFI